MDRISCEDFCSSFTYFRFTQTCYLTPLHEERSRLFKDPFRISQ